MGGAARVGAQAAAVASLGGRSARRASLVAAAAVRAGPGGGPAGLAAAAVAGALYYALTDSPQHTAITVTTACTVESVATITISIITLP